MKRFALMTIALAALAGCKKSDSSTAAPEQAAEDKAQWGDQVPDDATSRAFAAELVRQTVEDFRVTDDGAVLTYRSLRFKADGSWSASGEVAIADEEMECAESGEWTMDAAETETKAMVNYTIDRTDCAGREAGSDQRVMIDINGDDVVIRFR